MPSSYTEKQRNQMIEIYAANPCIETVEKLMTILNRPKRSIISKLVKEGVYVTKGYLTKTGETPISKLEIVRHIEEALDTPLPGLDKTPKSTLKELMKSIVEQTHLFEEALDSVQELSESHGVMVEMVKNKRSSLEEAQDILES